jgi:16S rRNA (cytosine967-C5)-methyltransferase
MQSEKAVKLHSPILIIVSSVVDAIVENGYQIDKTLQPVLQNKTLGSRDRKFIISGVYDIIRNYIFYDSILTQCNDEDLDWHQQMTILNLVHQGVNLLNPEIILPNASDLIEKWKILLQQNEFDEATVLGYSDWFYELGAKDYGKQWTMVAKALNQPAPIYLRANVLKTTPEKLFNQFQQEDIEVSVIPGTNALLLPNRDNIRNHNLNKKGHFEIQDLASQSIGPMAKIQHNQLIIDVCAGAGGKSLQMASLLKNTGKVIATDIQPERLEHLKIRAQRAGATNIEIVEMGILTTYFERADRVLLDVPCTGSGTIRRQPEIKLHLTEEKLEEYIETQQYLLEQYHTLVKPGGLLIYATCSIFKSESEEQVEQFITKHTDFTLVEQKRFLPPTHNCDGFYVGVMKKNQKK